MKNGEKRVSSSGSKTVLLGVGVWVLLRLLTSLLAALFSTLRPLTALEKSLPLWPPSGGLSAWLERAGAAPWLRWDTIWFERILTQGYTVGDGTTNFQPLFPWAGVPLHRLGIDPAWSLLIVASLAALALFVIFHRLARLQLDPTQAETALLCLATFPVAFILFAPYSDGFFLLWVAVALFLLHRRRPIPAAAAVFLAALTRQQGLFLILPVAWEAWEASGRSLQNLRKILGGWWLALLSAPAGLICWTIYRLVVLHEGHLDFGSVQGLIYSAMVSSSASQVVPRQAFLWPWQTLSLAFSKAYQSPDLDIGVNLVLAAGFMLALLSAWKYMRNGERWYSIAITLVSFSYYTGPIHPVMGLPRHLLAALPIFIGLGARLDQAWKRGAILAIQFAGFILLLLLYVLEAWVP